MKHSAFRISIITVLIFTVDSFSVLAQSTTGLASSQLDNFAARAIIQVLIIAVLVATLLGGGMLILNLGLLSKRQQDRTGGRTPSDVGILQTTNWPESPAYERIFPAEEEDEEDLFQGDRESERDHVTQNQKGSHAA